MKGFYVSNTGSVFPFHAELANTSLTVLMHVADFNWLGSWPTEEIQ